MQDKKNWKEYAIVGFGIFLGSFWLMFGFLSIIGMIGKLWYAPIALAPGAAVLTLVLLARRSPKPYGTGLIALGILPIFVAIIKQTVVETALIIGAPVVLSGCLFIIYRALFEPKP